MTTQDVYLLDRRLKLNHLEKGFKTSIDSVLLAAACPVQAGQHILDLGCGVGGAGLCVLTRIKGVKLTGVEIQQAQVDLANHNAAENDMARECTFIHSDIRDFTAEKATFDHVIINPPYLKSGSHRTSPHPEKQMAIGDQAQAMFVKDWVNCAHDHLKSKGSLTIIHRAEYVDEIIRAMGKRFGQIEIIPLWPKQGVRAKRVIIRALKHRVSPAIFHEGLTLHDANGDYTIEANEIFKELKKLF